MGFENPNQLSSFESLSPKEKVEAVLAAVQEPVSRGFTLQLAGVEDSAEFEEVFSSAKTGTGEGDEEHFMLGESSRQVLAERIDMKTVHGRIANTLMGDMY